MAESTAPAATTRAERRPPAPLRLLSVIPTPYLLIAAPLIILSVVLLWPIIQMVWYSLSDYTLPDLARGDAPEWNNFEHYRQLLTDAEFWTIFRNTVLVVIAMVAGVLTLGTLVGLLLHKLPRWFSTVVATGMMLAWATPQISASLIYRWLFLPERGLVNYTLANFPEWLVGTRWGEFWTTFNWFLQPLSLFTILAMIIIWQGFPFVAVTVLAGLKSVPYELYEAARVDGASAWRQFWSITYPVLRPLFALLLVLQIIWNFRIFTQLYILAGGFQNRDVYLLSYYIYQQGFRDNPPDYGMGSALAVTMTILILIVSAYYLRMMIRQGETR
ncbi:sugar ABC transporter permease [Lipingzhangella sp. LS1_29]|uniref:Sugar ABC transporter permease n=1 Tax=Lipingzhangella rawalii TaxID=2055835 RepID=A0ABU2HA26_9ACTN|nr:sugar ABC transporter permease [Lipingzhangella rawalii]MDS1271685.1 sugar ABC transporter permease [Lipingzhangella rawalii]